MVDRDLLLKKLAMIETCTSELERLARLDRIEHDVREERFVVHTLQLAIQAALDVAAHIVADRRLGEPETNRALFDLLAADGWIARPLTGRLRDMAGFRNVVVHGYETVDLRIVRDIVEHRLTDLGELVAAVRARLDSNRDRQGRR